ncbi:hypothetical protein P167DRAFT_540516 [Morchella conica CCBAS932]|uniref:Uncharacterized protein n=2 Tax=Morchella sect. Distantes TaxID=1051054 RepID=A0A3N4KBP3_9PEZI|nr:hypothetical protein P167DRAFT_540516 [Morchella conica CCBAS932]
MSLYYVYMRWLRKTDERSGSWARQLLTCESRYVADEFFRACQDLKDNRGQPRFTKLERSTPQFWIYDTTDSEPWNALVDILCKSPLPASVEGRVMSTLLHDGVGREWPVAPVAAGRDWVNGNTYFVRNIRQPNLYWFDDGSNPGILYISNGGNKTKFRVVGTDMGSVKRVLIRSEVVRLEIPQSGNSPTRHLLCDYNNRLVCASGGGGWTFKFGDLLGRFGTRFIGKNQLGIYGAVTWGEGNDPDEWELC